MHDLHPALDTLSPSYPLVRRIPSKFFVWPPLIIEARQRPANFNRRLSQRQGFPLFVPTASPSTPTDGSDTPKPPLYSDTVTRDDVGLQELQAPQLRRSRRQAQEGQDRRGRRGQEEPLPRTHVRGQRQRLVRRRLRPLHGPRDHREAGCRGRGSRLQCLHRQGTLPEVLRHSAREERSAGAQAEVRLSSFFFPGFRSVVQC